MQSMKEHGEVLQIRLPVSTMAKVRKMAKKRKTSISEIGRLAVAEYLSSEIQTAGELIGKLEGLLDRLEEQQQYAIQQKEADDV